MPATVVPFVLEYTWEGTFGGRPWANVMHTVWSAGSADRTPANLASAAILAEDAWNDYIRPVMAADCVLTNVRIQDIDSLSGQVVNLASNMPGTGLGEPFPGNVAILVTKETIHDRTQRNGRWFQVGCYQTEDDATTPGTLTAGSISFYQTPFNNFLTRMQQAVALFSNVPVVLSRSATAPSGYTPHSITAMTVQSRLATIRRRLRG